MTNAGSAHAADDLAGRATHLASENGICAIALATLKDGRTALEMSVSGCGAQPGSGAVFQAASLSKPVVACLVLRMVQAGGLALDRPVSEILPDGYPHRQNLFALKANPIVDVVPTGTLRLITPRMLLSHSAGFPNWSASGPLTPDFTPGTGWQYSGEGYVLLQHILETVTRRSLQQLAQDELFAPLRMTDTAFKITDSIASRLVHGAPRQLRFPYEIAASSLYTSAGDYARFTAAILNDDKMLALISDQPFKLPPSSASAFQSTGLAWGLGWGIEVAGLVETPFRFL